MTRVSYPVAAIALARTLHEGEWSLVDIAKMIEKDYGHRPAVSTIKRWLRAEVQERAAATSRASAARAAARTAGFVLPGRTPEYREAFRERLLAAGVRDVDEVCSIVLPGVPEARTGRIPPGVETVTTKEACAMLDITLQTLMDWRQRGRLSKPFPTHPRRYRRSEIESLVGTKGTVTRRAAVAHG